MPMDETQTDRATRRRHLRPRSRPPTARPRPVPRTRTTSSRRSSRSCDPELGINIVDLGLVYDVDISQGGGVHIEYTLTTMGCPIGPLIEHQMESFLAGVPGVEARSTRRWSCGRPWSPEMMSEEAKAALGYF